MDVEGEEHAGSDADVASGGDEEAEVLERIRMRAGGAARRNTAGQTESQTGNLG